MKMMKEIELEQVLPQEIEKRSFEIITEELGDVKLVPGTEPVVKRCIHTSADFDYAKNLVFSDGVIEHALRYWEAVQPSSRIRRWRWRVLIKESLKH